MAIRFEADGNIYDLSENQYLQGTKAADESHGVLTIKGAKLKEAGSRETILNFEKCNILRATLDITNHEGMRHSGADRSSWNDRNGMDFENGTKLKL